MAVRRLTRADAATFREVRLQGLRDHPEAFTASYADEAAQPLDWFADRLDGGMVFGGGADGRIDGVAGLHIPTGEKVRHKGLLWGMYVRAEARGTGLARQLIAAVLDAARGRVEEVMLGVGIGNAAAIGCYRAAGFEVCGLDLRAIKLGDCYIDELQMTIRFEAA